MPPPPALPKYDVNEEPPKWSFQRVRWMLPVERTKPWTEIGTQPKSPDDPDWRGVIRNEVIEYEMPEPYKYGRPTSPRYFWFDTPDYADPFKKLGYSFKWFLLTGCLFSAGKGATLGLQFTTKTNLNLARTIVVPWLVAGMAGSATVLCLANLRGKKDDMYNYLAAGVMMGSILGRKNHASWFRWMCIMPALAIGIKLGVESNAQLLPVFNYRATNSNITGADAEHGWRSGDLRFGFSGRHPDPGRDVRRVY